LVQVAVHNVENSVMQRANHLRPAQGTFDKRTAVVRATRTDCIKLIAVSNEQNARLVGGELLHLSGFEVSDVREVNVFGTHCFCQATLTRWPIFSFLVFK
jgi:hypothetical protein